MTDTIAAVTQGVVLITPERQPSSSWRSVGPHRYRGSLFVACPIASSVTVRYDSVRAEGVTDTRHEVVGSSNLRGNDTILQ